MPTILVVDDEPLIRRLLIDVLTDATRQVHEAADGVQALERIAEHSYDLVITDLLMPRMDGFELIARLRQDYPDLPVVVISGTVELEVHARLEASGVYAALRKPVDLMDLLNTASRAMRLGRKRGHSTFLQDEPAQAEVFSIET